MKHSTIGMFEEAAAIARQAAIVAGEKAMAYFRPGARTAARNWSKGGGSPVTQADIEIDHYLHDTLRRATPGYGWISEEETENIAATGEQPIWIVDPIDGTRAFMAGENGWSISIALVTSGRPVAACLHMPALGVTHVSIEGQGTTTNGQHAAMPDGADPTHLVSGPKSILDRFLTIRPELIRHPRIPSLAARIAAVGEKRIGLALASSGAHAWDVAAADLIVREAGGRLSGIDGEKLFYIGLDQRFGPLIASLGPDHDRACEDFAEALRENQDQRRSPS